MKSKIFVPVILVAVVAVLAIAGSFVLWIPEAMAAAPIAGEPVLAADVWKWGLVSAALATGLSSIGAAYAVAQLGSAAMGVMAEKPELFGRLLIFVGLAEGIAIYGVIISVLILDKVV